MSLHFGQLLGFYFFLTSGAITVVGTIGPIACSVAAKVAAVVLLSLNHTSSG
jgi:hypothetical protein